jgi:Tol biopolymer transport system component
MNADGTGQAAIPTANGRRIVGWSPDERKMLYVKPDDPTKTYLANADGSGEVLLHFRSGNWSSDSKSITYWAKVSGHNYDVFIYSVETGETRNITNSDGFDADPSFSPDGTRIAFVSTRDGNGEIYTINLDGSDLRRITFNPTADSHPAFSPDGTQILFTSDRENENADVYLMNSDGSSPVKVTNWDKSNETAGPGGWSRDGTKIAFFSDRDGKDDLYVVSAEISRPKLVFADPECDIRTFSHSPDGKRIIYSQEMADKSGELRVLDLGSRETSLVRKTELPATSADWSPQGDMIAFHDRIDGNSEVCLIRSDGRDFRILTNDPSPDAGPSWSPDGARIVFMSYRGEPRGVGQLYLMNADGTDPRPITPRKGWEGDPAWWPDGGRFVFVCDRNDAPGMGLDICEIGVDGTGEKHVLFKRDHESHPVVSPDGGRIAFTSSAGGNTEIYLMNSDGSGLLRLTRHQADDQWPEWTPDGRKLMFISNRNGKYAIYEIEVVD